MPKFLVYPENYDPMVATGPPCEELISIGVMWTEEDTNKSRELESQARIVEVEDRRFLPIGLWHQEV